MQLPTIQVLLTAGALFSATVQADYQTDKAIQVDFHSDTTCTSYAGEMPFWHFGDPPFVGYNEPFKQYSVGDCHNFRQPKGTQSLTLAHAWHTDGAEWPNTWAECNFFDDWDCKGEKVYVSGTCLAGRSANGWQWKSAQCSIFHEPPHSGTSFPQ